jgi:hypothetical protein
MAFIVDVRRDNLALHLMYKALFELSADRREFVSRLFSKAPPGGLEAAVSADELFAAYHNAETSPALFKSNLASIIEHLVRGRSLPLPPEDLATIEKTYRAFFQYGPGLRYSRNGGVGSRWDPSYVELMVATDNNGEAHGFLSSEKVYQLVRDLQLRNMIVPVVGDFAGPRSIRAVGAYVEGRQATVSAFYLSNVEQYLRRNNAWKTFCGNVAALPVDETSTFIRAPASCRSSGGWRSKSSAARPTDRVPTAASA